MNKYYSQQVINELRNIDLLTYLKNYEPEELVRISRDNYCTKTHDSLKISNGKWYWFTRSFGGVSALDYLIKVKELTFLQAVEKLQQCINECEPVYYTQLEKSQNNKLVLPLKNENNNVVIKYLSERGIDKEIIQECISKEYIYEEYKYHNVVFVGYDKYNSPKYVFKRGTNNTRFMQEVLGGNKAFAFKLESNVVNDCVHVFESAIDLLSYATLLKLDNKEWYNENLLSLGGVYKPLKNDEYRILPISLNLFLNNNPDIKKIKLHLDNDFAGRSSTNAIKKLLENRYEVIDEPPLYGKDFNDFLCKKLNIGKNRQEVGR